MFCSLCYKPIVGDNYARNGKAFVHETCFDKGIIPEMKDVKSNPGKAAREYIKKLEAVSDLVLKQRISNSPAE